VAIYDLPAQAFRTFTPTDFQVTQIAWSPTGDRLIVVDSYWLSSRSSGAMLDAQTGAVRFPIAAHSKVISSVDWASDGESFLTAAMDGLLLIWDAASGQVRRRIVTTHTFISDGKTYEWSSDDYGLGMFQYATFNADGSKIVNYFWDPPDAPSPYEIFTVWDAQIGEEILQYHENRLIYSASWHPTDPVLLLIFSNDFSYSRKEVSTYNVTNRQESRRTKPDDVRHFPGAGWTPDGGMVYVTSNRNDPSGHATFLDGKTFEARFTIPRDQSFVFYKDLIVFDKSRNHVEDKGPTVWDAQSGQQLAAIIDGVIPEQRDGSLIIGKDANGIETAVDARSGVHIDHYNDQLLQEQSSAYALAWSPDGTQLITAGDAATLWNVKTGIPTASFKAHIEDGQYSDHTSVSWAGQLIALREANGLLALWNPDGPHPYPLPPELDMRFGSFESDVAISPDGTFIAVRSGGTTRLYDMQKHLMHRPLSFDGTNLAWSPDSRYLAGLDPENSLSIWDVVEDRRVTGIAGSGHNGYFDIPKHRLAWSPDGSRVALIGQEQTIIFQGVTNPQEVSHLDAALPGGESSEVIINAFAWHVSLLAVTYNVAPDWYSDDPVSKRPRNTIILWDVNTGTIVRSLTGHNADIADIAFSPDGTLLASVDVSGVALLWSMR
jgi:WD40 repeat protein